MVINAQTFDQNAKQYNSIQYNTILHNTIQYNTTQYNTIQYNTYAEPRLVVGSNYCTEPAVMQSIPLFPSEEPLSTVKESD